MSLLTIPNVGSSDTLDPFTTGIIPGINVDGGTTEEATDADILNANTSIIPGITIAPTIFSGANSETAHTTLVSIGVILLVTIVIVQLAGINKDWAAVGGLLFLGVLLIQGMTHSDALSNLAQYPEIPN
jgi:hypothetical protein